MSAPLRPSAFMQTGDPSRVAEEQERLAADVQRASAWARRPAWAPGTDESATVTGYVRRVRERAG